MSARARVTTAAAGIADTVSASILRAAGSVLPDVITVLCYHRVADIEPRQFQGFRPNISATPERFRAQMDLVRTVCTPTTMQEIARWLDGTGRLPPRPVLITFDDGYKDNVEVAWPILRSMGIVPAIFLATDHIGSQRPFLWDLVAYCFHAAPVGTWELPLIGRTRVATADDRNAAASAWMQASKARPASDRWTSAEALVRVLGLSVPDGLFSNVCMSWEDVAAGAWQGIEFGGHTQSHPILTKTSPAEAHREIVGSLDRVADAIGRRPIGFAYPNGSAADFDDHHERSVRSAGCRLAFSLNPGPTRHSELRRNPMAVRRIYVGGNDTMGRFVAKLLGAGRVRRAPPNAPVVQPEGAVDRLPT